MQKHVLYILIFVICASCHVKDDVQLPEVVTEKIVLPSIKMEDKYQFFVDRFLDTINMAMADRACPGLAITIVHDSTILALQGIGLANEQTGKPVSAETIFRLGSVSKGFAAVLTQILVKEGYLSWDDPIIKYIPEFAFRDTEQSDQITIHHLLSQSTGLPPHTFTNYLESGKDVSEILHMLEGVNTVANPGEICTYQN
ncbi:MAG TPA: serine hydrolase domain-containing protein, partial [Saprospiraceae bacterium]|nr:serine hydrolase domain-containing protein [Saprospiraceae bacterium]